MKTDKKKAFDPVSPVYNMFMRFWRLYKPETAFNMLNPANNAEIADLGGGTGHYSLYFAKKGCKVTLVDESPGMLNRAESHENITKLQGDIINTPLGDNYFDCVLLNDVLHHVKDQNRIISRIYGVLKPGGKLFIYDFSRDHFITGILKVFEELLFGPMYYRTSSEILELCGNNSLELVKQAKKGFSYFLVLEKPS